MRKRVKVREGQWVPPQSIFTGVTDFDQKGFFCVFDVPNHASVKKFNLEECSEQAHLKPIRLGLAQGKIQPY